MILCRHFWVSGYVQGVWYRAHTQKQAVKRGVTGWAKNLPDGRVEVFACGEKTALDELEQWLWQGSPASKVEDVVSQEEKPAQSYVNFEVLD